jgi:hypothetical protein
MASWLGAHFGRYQGRERWRSRGNRAASLCHQPPGASGRQDAALRGGADHAFALAPLALSEAREGRALPNRNFHGPPVARLGQEHRRAPGEIGGEKYLQEGRGLRRLGRRGRRHRAAKPYHPDHASWQDGLPQPSPPLDQRPGFRGNAVARRSVCGQPFSATHQRACLRGTTPARPAWLRGQRRELAGAELAPAHGDHGRELVPGVLGGIAPSLRTRIGRVGSGAATKSLIARTRALRE